MSKKNFKIPSKPQPTTEAIDQFVNEGHGRDVQTNSTETQKHGNPPKQQSVPVLPTSRLTVDMPSELHRRFKSLCSLAGLKMNDEVRQFIEKRVTQVDQE